MSSKYFMRVQLSTMDGKVSTKNIEINCAEPIYSISDIEKIEKLIGKDSSDEKINMTASVLSWQKFENKPKVTLVTQ